MSNKILIPVIVVLSLITIGVASLTQLNKPETKLVLNTSSATISENKSSSVLSSLIPISSISNSSAQKVEESKNVELNPLVDQVNILKLEVLDSKNPPTYINDYFVCQKTSPTKEFGILIQNIDGKPEYKCPKSLEYYGCKFGLDWGDWTKTQGSAPGTKYIEGWTCDVPAFGRSSNYCGYQFGFPIEELNLMYIEENNVYAKIPSNYECIVILKKDLTENELNLLKSYNSPRAGSFKLITIKN